MSRSSLMLLAVLAIAAVAHGAKPGTSCAPFDREMCMNSQDGTFFENPADCSSPFCHKTYVVCYDSKTTVQNCPEDTVWSQSKKACIDRMEAPGMCPETCGVLNATMCSGKDDGSIMSNPTDCKVDDIATTFLYCLNETAVVVNCPEESFWDEAGEKCIKNGRKASVTAPKIPGYTAKLTEDMEEEDEEAWAPSWAPAQAPMAEAFPPMDYSFVVKSKDVLELSPSEVAQAIRNLTGADVDAAEPRNVQIMSDFTLQCFPYVLDDSTKQDVSDAMREVIADALSEYDVAKDDILIEDVNAAITSQSAELVDDCQTVTTMVTVTPSTEEKANVMELVQTLPEFETLFRSAALRFDNETAARAGVSSDVAAYLQENDVKPNDYDVVAEMTVTHTLGKEGQKKLRKAVENGALAKELEEVLGAAVETEEAAIMAPAPAPTREIEVNGAASAALGVAATAVVGAVATLALVL